MDYTSEVRRIEEEHEEDVAKDPKTAEVKLKQKMRYLRKPQIEQAKKEVSKFNPAFFELSEIWDYYYNKFDLFCV